MRGRAPYLGMFSPAGNAALAALLSATVENLRAAPSAEKAAQEFARGFARVAAEFPEATDAAVSEAIYEVLDRAGIPQYLAWTLVCDARGRATDAAGGADSGKEAE
jgi:hypothetical protein